MFTKLLLATSAIGALSAPVANYQHTTQEGNVNITYQYETNEVNSIDDLVVGNVYHFSTDTDGFTPSDLLDNEYSWVKFYLVNNSITFDFVSGNTDEIFIPSTITPSTLVYIDNSDSLCVFTADGDEDYSSIWFDDVAFYQFSCDIVLFDFDNLSNTIVQFLSASDYNVITNVQEVYHTGLFGNLADFLRYYVYGGIPHVTDISFEIGNQTITMLDWLVTTTSIALAILCIFLLYHFFRWVFKLVSGLIILR